MNVIDFILNVLGLMLWIDWRSGRLLARSRRAPVSLANSLKATERASLRPWLSLLALTGLILARGWFYWKAGSALDWTPAIRLGILALPFRVDLLFHMLLFSLLSFALALFAWHACLILLAAAQGPVLAGHPIHRFVRLQLGWLARLPLFLKLLFPFLTAALAWLALNPLLVEMRVLPAPAGIAVAAEQAGLLGLCAYLIWRWLLIALFGLHLLNTYIYLGLNPVWEYISKTASNLLRPVRFFRFGRVDLAPLIGIAAVFLTAEFGLLPLASHLFQQYLL